MTGKEKVWSEKLRGVVRGQVLTDKKSLKRYSRDQSIYEILPRTVVFPEDPEDVQRLVDFAHREGMPLTARGGGSGTAGGALGSGIIMALPDNPFWGRIGETVAAGKGADVHVGAGVYHNALQKHLKQRGFFLPADVSSADISRIGGNIATKASGPHALRYGSIDRFLTRVAFVTNRGEIVDTGDEKTIPQRIKVQLADLQKRLLADLPARERLAARQKLKTASGYNLFPFLDDLSPGERIARLLAGSVGTLGLVVDATLRVERHEPERATVLLYFDDLAEAGRAVCAMREMEIAAIEIISRETMQVLRERTELPVGLAVDAHLLLVELTGSACRERIREVSRLLKISGFRLQRPPMVAANEDAIEELWALRKQILWLIRHPQAHLRALSVVNDVGVPPERLAAFIGEVQQVFARADIVPLIYGHAGSGNLHLRPLFDVTLPDLPGRIRQLADAVYEVVLRHGGTVTAEHGMGPLRAPWLRREWGDALYGYMRQVKEIFDPDDLFNPGAMFGEGAITENLREDLVG